MWVLIMNSYLKFQCLMKHPDHNKWRFLTGSVFIPQTTFFIHQLFSADLISNSCASSESRLPPLSLELHLTITVASTHLAIFSWSDQLRFWSITLTETVTIHREEGDAIMCLFSFDPLRTEVKRSCEQCLKNSKQYQLKFNVALAN